MKKDLLGRKFTDLEAEARGSGDDTASSQARGVPGPGRGSKLHESGPIPSRSGAPAAFLGYLELPGQHELRLLLGAPHPHHPLQWASGGAYSLHRHQHGGQPQLSAHCSNAICSPLEQSKLLASLEPYFLFVCLFVKSLLFFVLLEGGLQHRIISFFSSLYF